MPNPTIPKNTEIISHTATRETKAEKLVAGKQQQIICYSLHIHYQRKSTVSVVLFCNKD